MRKKFLEKRIGADFNRIAEELNVDPLIVRIMVNRGVAEEDMQTYLHPSEEDLNDPGELLNVREAAAEIAGYIRANKRIRIIGDYDIDGIMSTYILVSCLRNLGADVDYRIPHRVRDGYGLNERLVEEAQEDGREAIITCDNGIAAFDAVKRARELGLDIIVTDHHIVPFEEVDGEKKEIIPPANHVVNPHLAGDTSKFKEICGAVVAWKVCFVVYEEMRVDDSFVWKRLENAGFATVGDVMPLVLENRSLVKLTLKRLCETENLGMRTLIRVAGIDRDRLSAFSIGFVLGPMMNASGRLSDATIGVELLLSEDEAEAERLATKLYELNQERKDRTEHGTALALEAAANYEDDKVLVIYLPEVTESVAGIIAGRVRENTGKPSIVLVRAMNQEDDAANEAVMVKGSGRSIEAYSMYEELNKCSDLLVKFGGHPMAAGLSLKEEDVDELRRRLNENTTLSDEDLVEKVYLDARMPLSYLNQRLVEELDRLDPFGNQNEKPVFGASDIPVVSARTIGKDGQYLKFTLRTENGGTIDALMFRGCEDFKDRFYDKFGESTYRDMLSRRGADVKLTFTFYPSLNTFRDETKVQVMISDVIL